jgi:hypothetical protein
VSWHLIPVNAAFAILFMLVILFSPGLKKLDAAFKAADAPAMGLPKINYGARVVLHASLPEIEYPHTPQEGVVFTGPIFTRVPKIDTSTWSELSAFLDKGRTVL